MKKKRVRLALLFMVLVASAGTFVYWYGFLRQEKPVAQRKVDFEIAPDSLFSVFISDENAANARYGGKVLQLTGRLVSWSRESNGSVTLTFVDPMMGVTCTIDSLQAVAQQANIERLAGGARVTVKGRCDGMLTDVKITRCSILSIDQ